MNKNVEYLNDKQLNEIIHKISAPTFRFFMRRLKKELLDVHKDMPLNLFMTIFINTITSCDANSIRWLENFYILKTGNNVDFEALKINFIRSLNDHLRTILQ